MYQFRWSYQDTYTKNQDSRQDTYAKNQELIKIQDWSVIKKEYNIKTKTTKVWELRPKNGRKIVCRRIKFICPEIPP